MFKKFMPYLNMGLWIIGFFLAAYILSNRYDICLDPFENTAFDMVGTVKVDSGGCYYIIDKGSARITKTNSSGETDYVLESSSGVFYYARDIAVDDGSYFYVLDLVWASDGMSIESERILAFDKNTGKLVKTVFECSYEQRQSLPCLKSITLLEGDIWFVQMDEKGFAVKSIPNSNSALEAETHLYEKYDDASAVLQDFHITKGEIFVLDKAGKIMSLKDGILTTIYTAKSGDDITQFSLPYDITKSEGLFFTDIGKRNICVIDGSGQRSFYAVDNIDYPQKPIYYSVYALGDRVIFSDSNTIYTADVSGEIIREATFAPPGQRLIALRISLLAAVITLTAILLYRLIKTFSVLKAKIPDRKQELTLVIVIVSLLVCLSVTPGIMKSLETESRLEMLNRLSTTVLLSQRILDTEAFESIKNPQDYYSESYEKLMVSLQYLSNDEYEWNSNIYCALYKYQGDNVYPIAFLDRSMGAFYSYGDTFEGSDIEAVIKSDGQFVTNENIIDISGSYSAVIGPVYDKDSEIIGAIEIGINLQAFHEKISEQMERLMVNIVLVIAILIFVMIEGVDVLLTLASSKKIKTDFRHVLLPVPYIRILTFIIFLAFNLTTGFLPIYASRFKAALWGVSPEICAALPLTINQVVIAISSVISGSLMKRIGMKRAFVSGAAFCVVGEVINATAPNFTVFNMGMILSGFGAGLVFSFINIYIASFNNVEHKAEGFSIFSSASFSGMNCGILIGATLAVVIGQASVFYVSSALWLAALCLFFVLINKNTQEIMSPDTKRFNSIKFLLSRNVFICLMLLLNYITLNGFLNYFVPVFGAGSGMLETEISLLFILHAIGITFIGPLILKRLEAKQTRAFVILLLSMLISISSILIFTYRPEIITLVIAVLALGCSNSLGYVYFPLLYSELAEAKSYGSEKSMSIFGAVENMGDAAGPFVFGLAVTAGLGMGFLTISAVSSASMLLFFVTLTKAVKKVRSHKQ